MKKTNKLLKQLLLSGCFIACLIFFSACHSTKYLTIGQKVTYVDWQITFKEKTSKLEKEKALVAIERKLIEDFYAAYPNTLILNLKFNLIPSSLNGRAGYRLSGFIDPGDASQSGFATVKPHPGGPRRDYLNLSPAIDNIQIALPGGQFGELE